MANKLFSDFCINVDANEIFLNIKIAKIVISFKTGEHKTLKTRIYYYSIQYDIFF